MHLNNYSNASRLLHKTYLNNYFVSKTSFELEQSVFQKRTKNKNLNEIVFITGLARAGTTALFNHLYNTSSFASLTYADMPYLLMPNLAKLFLKAAPSGFVERAHQDGIMMNNKSPEAFDEYFWKVFLNDAYIKKNNLNTHLINKSIIDAYKKYMQLIAYSYKSDSYLSKNNNNILRLPSLMQAFPLAKFMVLYREPLSHAHSLLKQHIHFSKWQQQDHFAVDYFNYLGHHEFGLNHKPFCFSKEEPLQGDQLNLNYWLKSWENYYSYLLANYDERLHLIAFEDLCTNPDDIAAYLNKIVLLKEPVSITNKHQPQLFTPVEYNEDIYNRCSIIFKALNAKRAYNHRLN